MTIGPHYVHCDSVHLDDCALVPDNLSASAIEEVGSPGDRHADLEAIFEGGRGGGVGLDGLHCVLDHVRIVGPDGGQGNFLEEGEDCDDGAVSNSAPELESPDCEDEGCSNDSAYDCHGCEKEGFFLLLAGEYVFEHASIVGPLGGHVNG